LPGLAQMAVEVIDEAHRISPEGADEPGDGSPRPVRFVSRSSGFRLPMQLQAAPDGAAARVSDIALRT
jgi:hypothetical protein